MAMNTENTALVSGGRKLTGGRVMLTACKNMGVDGVFVVTGQTFVCDEADGTYIFGKGFARTPTPEEADAYNKGNAMFGVPKVAEPVEPTIPLPTDGGKTLKNVVAAHQNAAKGVQ